MSWNFRNKLLITGTPLQNSLKELWALLHFLEPSKFPDCDAFEQRYSLDDAEGVAALHAELRPHLLRRVIKVHPRLAVDHRGDEVVGRPCRHHESL